MPIRTRAALLVSVPVYSRHDRSHHLAGAEPRDRCTHPPWVGVDVHRAGGFHYKKSRQGNAEIDRAAAHVLRHHSDSPEILDFSPYGYDERQYCSPGFNLPIGCLMRSVWGTFPEYHTSADNLDFIRPPQLAGSLGVCAAILDVLENNR